MSILIIRHGETECNLSGVIQFGDDALSERGKRQAERLAERLAGGHYRLGAIVCSDYQRARDTAGYVHAATGAPQSENPLLRERHFGELRGRRASEVGDIWRADLAPGGGEDWQRFHDRVASAWRDVTRLAAATSGDLAVVTHGMVCYSLMLNQLQCDSEQPRPKLFGNASLTEVDAAPPWPVRLFDCRAHLQDLDRPADPPNAAGRAAR